MHWISHVRIISTQKEHTKNKMGNPCISTKRIETKITNHDVYNANELKFSSKNINKSK